ncbi:MAG: PDZ domain-containing protein [Acidobacteriota bacterium]|nr:PDZ domain-containing protein [Acidobacteriota bacterium]
MAVISCQVPGAAQVSSPSAPSPPSPAAPKVGQAPTGARSGPVVEENRPTAPQVVTILHRLNGLKMFRLLLRSSEELRAIARLDDTFKITDEVHTNVIAGLALDDGQTIAAWLPDAEAGMGPPPSPFAPGDPMSPMAPPPGVSGPSLRAARVAPGAPLTAGAANFFERSELTVIARDGKRLIARYVGLDGVTGLSILKLSEKSFPRAIDAKEAGVGIGQRLRLFGPEPVAKPESRTGGTIYARMGETKGTVIGLARSPSGTIARVKVKSTKLSAANIGGIAVNDAGETVGIVDAVEDSEASVVPTAMVRTAAKRVLDRQASVPRPWLGVRGDPVGALQLEQLLTKGWEREGALSLAEARRGIMLTSVAPGSPAAGAALRPGDVILRVNQEDVRSADDFSWLLEEVGPGRSVNFTVARPGKTAPEGVEITLSESPDPLFEWRFKGPANLLTPGASIALPRAFFKSLPRSLIAQGIETIALQPQVAARFGASGGLLVVYVQPSTAAFMAGLRSGDLIEAIDGKRISATSEPVSLFTNPVARYSFSVVRNKEKLVISVTPQK